MAFTSDALAELVALARASVAVQPPPEHGGYALIPEGMKLQDITNEHADRPERIKGTVKVFDPASFCEYFTTFKDDNSRVFADETASRIVAVLDYHQAGKPRWGSHRLDLTLRHSKEWKEWGAANGKKMTQMEFGEFVEDHAPDIVAPDAATMLEVARNLSAKTDVDFSSAIRMANGSVQLKYSEQVKGTYGSGQFEVPETFIIAIPVYLGHERTSVTARLRWRLNAGKLTFFYDLLRASVVEREAFLAARSAIAENLGITVINGTPA